MDPRALFLARIHADAGLQQQLRNPAIAAIAVSIARAAGLVVTPADLQPVAVPPPAVAAEGDLMDFDGDGIPDAVRRGDRWELTD